MSNTEPNTSSQGLQEEPSALLPPIGRQLLILAWLLLFGGRWLIAPLLQINGLLTPQALAALDEGPLMKLYLVLFCYLCHFGRLAVGARLTTPYTTHQRRGDTWLNFLPFRATNCWSL